MSDSVVYIGIDPAFSDSETAIAICEKHGRSIVCRAVARTGNLQDAIMDVAMAGQRTWTHQELDELNERLDGCQLPIRAWLERQR